MMSLIKTIGERKDLKARGRQSSILRISRKSHSFCLWNFEKQIIQDGCKSSFENTLKRISFFLFFFFLIKKIYTIELR